MKEIIILILSISMEMEVPKYFSLAVALTENPALDSLAVNINKNGTKDFGIMQLNDSWFKGDKDCIETNIRTGIKHIKEIMNKDDVYTYWSVAVIYNSGYSRLHNPPQSTIEYANKVMEKYNELTNGNIEVVVRKK